MNELNQRITRLTALMAGHGLTFLQVYTFYTDVAQAYLHPHLRAQVVTFGAAMLIGVASAYIGLMVPDDKRPILRRGAEAVSAGLLVVTWIVLGNAFLNLH